MSKALLGGRVNHLTPQPHHNTYTQDRMRSEKAGDAAFGYGLLRGTGTRRSTVVCLSAATSLLDLHLQLMYVQSHAWILIYWITDVHAGHRRADQVLQAGSVNLLPDPVDDFHAGYWICTCWTDSTVPRPSKWNDMAGCACFYRHVLELAQCREQACERLDHLQVSLFSIRVSWIGSFLLSPRSPLSSSELFQRHYLVRA